jgi:hypothetical protein
VGGGLAGQVSDPIAGGVLGEVVLVGKLGVFSGTRVVVAAWGAVGEHIVVGVRASILGGGVAASEVRDLFLALMVGERAA